MPFCGPYGRKVMIRIFRGSSIPTEDVVSLVFHQVAKWVSGVRKFNNLNVGGVLHNWEASLLFCDP